MPVIKHTDVTFAPIPNVLGLDERITLTALRVAIYILNHHPDWKISVADVSKQTKIDRRSTTRAFDLLEECGYMKADRILIQDRMCRTNIHLSNKPEFVPPEPTQAKEEPVVKQQQPEPVVEPVPVPAPPSMMTEEELAEDMARHRKMMTNFSDIINKKTQAGSSTKVGSKIVKGAVLSSFGAYIRQATAEDYENLREAA